MLVNNDKGHDQLGVVPLADRAVKVVGGFANADVGHCELIGRGGR